MSAVFVKDTPKEYRDETGSCLDELNDSLSKLQRQQDSFQTEILTMLKSGMTTQPSCNNFECS